MALRRVLWIGVPAVAAALLTVAILPPRPLPDRTAIYSGSFWTGWFAGGYYAYFGSGAVLEDNAATAANRLRTRVEQARRGDSLIALAQRAGVVRSADGLVTVLYDPSLPADTARRILGTAERELAFYPRGDGAGMPAIVAVYTDSARHPDLRKVFWRRHGYVRTGGRGSACIVELNRTDRGKRYDPRTGGWPLNGCAVYARFGARGGAVGGASLTYGFLENPYNWQSTLTDQVVQERIRRSPRPAPWEWRPTWVPFFLDTDRYQDLPPFQWRWSACLAGSDHSCLAASGLLGRRESLSWTSWYVNPFLATSLVADLVATGDVRRFAAFWRSDLPYAQALERAYGTPPGRLVRDVARRQWIPGPHGPHITTRVVSAAVGWLVVALGLAIVAGRRRQARG